MASSIFSSNTSEFRWVDQLSEHFIIYVDNPPSIFQVPKSVNDTNPEAYAPQQIGIGAYHHLRPDLDEMESRKLEAVKKFLKPEKCKNFKSLIVDKIKVLEPSIRSCYNKYLDLDGDTLAWIMAIDGVYLLHLLSTYSSKKTISVDDRKVARDIMMMENQLPCFVLKEIRKALQPTDEDKMDKKTINFDERQVAQDTLMMENQLPCFVQKIRNELKPPDEDHMDEIKDEEDNESVRKDMRLFSETVSSSVLASDIVCFSSSHVLHDNLFSDMLSFFESHTPLELPKDRPYLFWITNSPHLLHIMYTLIRDELSEEKRLKRFQTVICSPLEKSAEIVSKTKDVAKVAGELTGLKPLILLGNLPLQEFVDLFRKNNQTADSLAEEIKIPSASELHGVSKIEFKVWDSPSGSGVKYDENNRILYLPKISLNTDSEVILRNLVAYEVASGSNDIVSGYVDFMCGIIDTAKDVDLLRERYIIKSDLPSEEIAKMFDGISKSDRMKPDLKETTEKLNVVHDSIFRVKAWRFIKDHLVPSEGTVKLILGILLVLLLTLQAFCQVYGCRARWFGKNQKISSI